MASAGQEAPGGSRGRWREGCVWKTNVGADSGAQRWWNEAAFCGKSYAGEGTAARPTEAAPVRAVRAQGPASEGEATGKRPASETGPLAGRARPRWRNGLRRIIVAGSPPGGAQGLPLGLQGAVDPPLPPTAVWGLCMCGGGGGSEHVCAQMTPVGRHSLGLWCPPTFFPGALGPCKALTTRTWATPRGEVMPPSRTNSRPLTASRESGGPPDPVPFSSGLGPLYEPHPSGHSASPRALPQIG